MTDGSIHNHKQLGQFPKYKVPKTIQLSFAHLFLHLVHSALTRTNLMV